MSTEEVNKNSAKLDALKPEVALDILLGGQKNALKSVDAALSDIAAGAKAMAETVRGEGSLAYAAAGSSGLMAMSDGLELPGTFSIPNDRIKILFAGGAASLVDMIGSTEDDEATAAADVLEAGLGAGDCIIGVSASGNTPYTVAAIRAAREQGAKAIGIANNQDTPLLQEADISILLETPAEVVAGSTRLGAATAQKVALNMMSTLMAIHLGHVHDGYMVNVRADNKKLFGRARKIVSDIGDCTLEEASGFLDRANGSVKTAVLLASGAENATTADELLATHGSNLRSALNACREKQ